MGYKACNKLIFLNQYVLENIVSQVVCMPSNKFGTDGSLHDLYTLSRKRGFE